jgi:transposase
VAARGKIRQFPTAYKLKAIKRAEGGEGVLPVARKLGISRKLLHDWIKAWKADGPDGLNRKRGPKPGPRRLKSLQADDKTRSALVQANARIAELERLVGRQQLDLDFFHNWRGAVRVDAAPTSIDLLVGRKRKSLRTKPDFGDVPINGLA